MADTLALLLAPAAKTIGEAQDQAGSKRLRTKLSTCRRKARYASAADAEAAAARARLPLRPYLCDRCGRHHLTSRTKGKRIPRPDPATG